MEVSPLSVLLLLIVLFQCGQTEEIPKPILRVDPNTTVYTGDTLTLTCDLQISLTGWRFRWYKDSQQLNPLTEYKDTNTLSITASDTETAEYLCIARRGHGGVDYDSHYSAPVKITVEIPKPTLRVDPHTTVYTGDTLTLTCDLQSSVTGWRFRWYKDSQQLNPLTEYKDTNTLSITVSDTGTAEYLCIARRGHGGVDYDSHYSAPVKITVAGKPKPELRSSLKGATLRGSSVTLECVLDQSAGWRFYWTKHTQNPQNEFSTETHSHTISSVSVSDGGQYWCKAGRGDPVNYTPYSDALWVNVTDLDSRGPGSSSLAAGVAVGSSLIILLIILSLVWCCKKNKGGGSLWLTSRNKQNTSQRQNLAGPEDTVSASTPLQSDAPAESSDVTYVAINLKSKKKPKKKQDLGYMPEEKTTADTDQKTIYSELKLNTD
ncbi:leukocyte immunoglobulin-like receptor subfamily A member 2 [Salminus brasiliensis]|uniref:leukocyte immunoglobulin-like receptor subfamily A member 2 n=1 Tax=Salminus brasiliensis TaxID=930266 RepID=UPI003B837896